MPYPEEGREATDHLRPSLLLTGAKAKCCKGDMFLGDSIGLPDGGKGQGD